MELNKLKLQKRPVEEVETTKRNGLNKRLSRNAVNYPPHYTSHPSGVECITVTRHMSFNLGNAVKYIWRAALKGNQIQDLEKAVFYINDEIERLKSHG